MSARIFISHSAKDFEPAFAAGATDDERARDARRQYARAVRDRVFDKLEAAGHDVWLDRESLKPGGERWRATIHRLLGTCQGAVMLLDEDSVTSPWLIKEATILSWRRSLNPQLRLVPVFLGGFRSGDLARSALAPLQISEENAARLGPGEEDAERLADQTVAAFAGLPTDSTSTAMTKWIRDVADAVGKAGVAHVRDAAVVLGVDEDELAQTAVSDLDDLVAHHLLNLPLVQTLGGLTELARSAMPRESLQRLVKLLIPTWVDVSAASSFYRLACSSAARAPVVINGRRKETGEEYVRRALFGEPDEAIPVGWEPLGEEHDTKVLELYEAELAKRFPGAAPTRQDLKAYVQMFGDRQYVLVGDEAMRPGQLEELRRHYPWPMYVLLPGGDYTEARRLAPDAEVVLPELGPMVEDSVAPVRLKAHSIANG